MELTSTDLRYIVRELDALRGAKVEKIMQGDAEKRDLLFTMYLRDHPKIHLRFLLPGMVCQLPEKPEAYPKVPPGFAMFLRKYLEGTRLNGVRQVGADRIIEMLFASKDEEFTLAVEFVPPGNMLLLMDGKIRNLLENQQFKDRTLRGGVPYVLPPSPPDVLTLSEGDVRDLIMGTSRDSIVTTLAIDLGLGGVYAEEACVRADIEKRSSKLTPAQVDTIVAAVRGMLAEPITPCADATRVYPIMMRSRETTPCAEGSFLTALARFGTSTIEAVRVTDEAKSGARKQSKLDRMVVAQEAQILEMDRVAKEELRKGEIIYEQYALIQELLAEVAKAREEKRDIAEALKRFPEFKRYDAATGKIEVELG